jgi:protein required for attachment to host cells
LRVSANMLVAHGTHIMVVDGANKSLFRNRGSAMMPELERMDHRVNPVKRTNEIGSDKPGRSFQSIGSARSAHEASDYHQVEEDHFATAAADQFNILLTDGVRGILIAPPHVLGVMRKRLKADVRARIIAEIDKDYAGRSAADITQLLVRL